MKTYLEFLKSSTYVIDQLSYSSMQFEGKKTASAAHKTLTVELNKLEEFRRSQIEHETPKFLDSHLSKLKLCLQNIHPYEDSDAYPLNVILSEYFQIKYDELKSVLKEGNTLKDEFI